MIKVFTFAVLTVFCFELTGCGQTGPLYLPKDQQKITPSTTQS